MVRSCALLFSWKKITFILKIIFCHCKCIVLKKNVEKICDARFLGAKTVLRIFLRFLKKVEKITFFAFFSEKSLWSQTHFRQKSCYHSSCENAKKMSQKKCQKKGVFIFWNFFFKMKIGHLFLSIFEIKKKVLKIKKLSIFSISPRYSVKWRATRHKKRPKMYQNILLVFKRVKTHIAIQAPTCQLR